VKVQINRIIKSGTHNYLSRYKETRNSIFFSATIKHCGIPTRNRSETTDVNTGYERGGQVHVITGNGLTQQIFIPWRGFETAFTAYPRPKDVELFSSAYYVYGYIIRLIVHEMYQGQSLFLKLSHHRIYISNVWKIAAPSLLQDCLPVSETLWLNSLLSLIIERACLIVSHSRSGNEIIIRNRLKPSTWVCHKKLGHGACPVRQVGAGRCVTRSARKFHLILRHRADKTYCLLALSYMIGKLLWCNACEKSRKYEVLCRTVSGICDSLLWIKCLLTHGAEPCLKSCQLCSHSRTSQHFMEPEGSINTVFTRALHWSLSCAISIQFIPSHPISCGLNSKHYLILC
jgi:hypothetical protein